VACWLWKRAPGHQIPQELHDRQVANARRAAEATTQAVSEAIPTEIVAGPHS